MKFLATWQTRIQALPVWQKVVIVFVVVVLPAGFILGAALFRFWSKHRSKG